MPYAERRGNKWRVRWNTGKKDPESGKWLYDSQGGFDDRDDAITYGLDRESDIRNDRYISRRDGGTLMTEYCKTWQQTLDVGHLRRRNIEMYIRLYIEPRWGQTTVADIKPSAYRAWEMWLKDQPNIGDGYRKEILSVFSMMMDDAVDDEMRKSSPVQRQRRRGKYVKRKPKERKRDMRIEDVHQLASNALVYWGFPGYVFFLTMAFTGMRPGELYALRREYCCPNWPASDPRIDPEEADRYEEDVERYAGEDPMPTIRVEWQHQRKDGVLTLLPPKYESRRTLVVPPFLAELLEMLLSSGSFAYVFPSISGGELGRLNFTYSYWRKIADGQEERHVRGKGEGRGGCRRWLPGFDPVSRWQGKRMYLLRHGHKEWIDDDGHSRVVTESRMGHELVGVEGVYANVTVAAEKRIMETLQARWLRFVATLPEGWEPPPSPTSLPVDLGEWMKLQVKAAKAAGF